MSEKKLAKGNDKAALNRRLKRIEGQVKGIQKKIEDDRYCFYVLSQLSAIDKAIGSLSSKLIDHHLHTCVVDDIKKGDLKTVDELAELFKRFN